MENRDPTPIRDANLSMNEEDATIKDGNSIDKSGYERHRLNLISSNSSSKNQRENSHNIINDHLFLFPKPIGYINTCNICQIPNTKNKETK